MKILSLICLATLFISCQTTKVYETQKLTKNGVEIYYSNSYMEDDDIVSQEERGNYKDVIIDHSHGISTFASVVYEKKTVVERSLKSNLHLKAILYRLNFIH